MMRTSPSCMRAQSLHHLVSAGRVQGRRGFIREHQGWIVNQSPGDCDALLLPTGQLSGRNFK